MHATPGIIFLLTVSVFVMSSCSTEEKFELQETTIADIHRALRSGACTCESLVKDYIKRIETYDKPSKLNAITLINPEALNQAVDLDKAYNETGKLETLHCIPLIVKDNYDVAGLPTTAGSLTLKNNLAVEDAWQVRKLKEAGAIVLARSNMAEWAFSPKVTISSIAGETLNPYNPEHVPAGSSGGTAAAVAANFGAAGLGTDTGNSIRGPSSHNALVGIRSTLGLTSRQGIVPLYYRNDVGGPMARTVEDAVRILEVIAGHDPADPITENCEGKVPENYTQYLDKDGLKGVRIGVLRLLSEVEPDTEIHALFEQAIEDIQKAGAIIIDPVAIPDFDSLKQNQWCPMFRHDINAYLASLGDAAPVNNLSEIVASGQYSGYIEEILEYFMRATDSVQLHQDGVPCLDPYSDTHRIAFRDAIITAMDAYEAEVLIYPTWNNPPAKVGDMEGYKGDNSQVIAPHTGQPAITVPMGYTSGNLPAGLQFTGRMYDEPTLIRIAYAYEQATMHRKPPALFPVLDE